MRSGLIAQKLGMTRVFTEAGEHVPVTVLKVANVQVLAQRTDEKNGYTALQLGAGSRKARRRVGRGKRALADALDRPEKLRRDAYVDTSRPGVSASHRRAGGTSTARRNTLKKTTRAAATLEDSRTVPSRKSTRRSANRGKPSHGKERTALAKAVAPSARAGRRGG